MEQSLIFIIKKIIVMKDAITVIKNLKMFVLLVYLIEKN